MATEIKISAGSIEKIILHKRNPRKKVAAVEKVAAAVKEFGFRTQSPIDKEGVIINGQSGLYIPPRRQQATGNRSEFNFGGRGENGPS